MWYTHSSFPQFHKLWSSKWYLENFEILQDGIIAKYHVQVMLLFVFNRSREIFGNTQETFTLWWFKNQTQASAFVTIFSQPNIWCHVLECKNITVFSVVMATLLYHPSFAVIPLLRGNSDALNQSHLQNFLAYIISIGRLCPVQRLCQLLHRLLLPITSTGNGVHHSCPRIW